MHSLPQAKRNYRLIQAYHKSWGEEHLFIKLRYRRISLCRARILIDRNSQNFIQDCRDSERCDFNRSCRSLDFQSKELFTGWIRQCQSVWNLLDGDCFGRLWHAIFRIWLRRHHWRNLESNLAQSQLCSTQWHWESWCPGAGLSGGSQEIQILLEPSSPRR